MMKKIFTLLLMAIMAVGYSWAAETETIDFRTIDFSEQNPKKWATSYDKHIVNGNEFIVTFTGASKQSKTIIDMPVIKSDYIEVSAKKEATKIIGVELTLKEWLSKAKKVYLYVYNGKSYGSSSCAESDKFYLTAEGFSTNKIKFTFGNSTNQVGVQSIKLTYTTGDEPQKTKTTLSFGTDIDGKTIDMNLGDAKTYTATLSPNVDGATISYESSAADVASVDNTGKVTALKEGTSTITATYAGNDTYEKSSASYTVNVKSSATPEESTGTIVFSNEQGSFANAKNAYESNSGTYELEMKASDKRNYRWTCYVANASSTNKGGIMFEKGKGLLQAKNCEIYSPKEFDLFDGYNVSITYKFNSTKATFEYKVGDVVKKVESTNTQLKTISFAVAPGETFALQNMSTTLAISKIEIIPNGYILKGTIVAERAGEVKLTGKNLRVVKQFKSKDGNSNMLVVKDADGEAVDKATVEGDPYHISYSNEGETVVKNQEEYGESNWFIVEVKGDDNTNYENKYLKSVTGTLTNITNWQMLATGGVYPTIEVNEDAEAEEYVPNAYTPVNFMVSAGSNKVKAEDGKEYFFMNPKRGEYVTVVDAVYKGGKFYVPAKEGSVNHYGFEGAVAIDDTYQVIPTGLEEDKFYSFDAIVLGIDDKAADKVAANDNSEVSTLYKVAPLNLTNKTVTGVDEVVTAKAVVSVTYYNLAGVASAKPFEGVSIVVTRYADGSTKATKELR